MLGEEAGSARAPPSGDGAKVKLMPHGEVDGLTVEVGMRGKCSVSGRG